MSKTAQCKKCGSTSVAWVQSKRTGKWYLAFATTYHGTPADGVNKATAGGVAVHAHIAHDCDDPAKGGRPTCERCGTRHGVGDQMICDAVLRDAQAEAPLTFEVTQLKKSVRHVLDRVDWSIRIYERPDVVELEVYGKGIEPLDEEFDTVEAAKAAAFAHLGIDTQED